jgi:hypothetical protein
MTEARDLGFEADAAGAVESGVAIEEEGRGSG